jgi:carbamoylphosphate synthase small subunit
VVYGSVDTKAITKEVREIGIYECHIINDPIRGQLWIGQASA